MSNLGRYGLPLPPNPRGDLPPLRQSLLQSIQRKAATPRSLPLPPQRAVEENIRRQQPVKRYEAPTRDTPQEYRSTPLPGGKSWTNDPREIMAVIAEFAKRRLVVIVRYSKLGEGGRVITRAVEPYSIRIRRRKRDGQIVRYFYGFDVNGPTVAIHSFIISNLVSVQGTNRFFNPRWVVEF